MGTHPLGGSASITIEKIDATFESQQPTIDPGRERDLLKFTEPEGRNNTASIKFSFKVSNINEQYLFGIKQFVQGIIYRYAYKGNKDIDGRISESYWTGSTWMLDCSTRSLTVLFDKDDVTTGVQGSAPQAPFFSEGPAFVRNGAAVELSTIDMPGGAHPLELRNASTNRVNYLQSIRRVERFLTVLTAVLPDGSHLPLEAVNWQHRIEGEVAWNENGKPDVTKIVQECKGLGRFPEIPPTFLYADYALLTDKALTVSDCIVQKQNDALYAVRGLHKRQDFDHPPRSVIKLAVRGYEVVQYPTWTGQ